MNLPDDLFTEAITLENKRARLLPLDLSHYHDLLPIALEASLWTWGLQKLQSPEDLKNYIQIALEERGKGLSYPFVIYDKDAEAFAGSTRYMTISLFNKRLEIGSTWLHPRFQGTGLNRFCKFELFEFAFKKLGMNRVELKTDVLNQASRKAILKTGAKEEGIFRSYQIAEGGRVRDSIFFSIIKEEWEGIRQTHFQPCL